MSLLAILLMSVNAVKNTPLVSTELNQSGSDFAYFHEKHNKTNCREQIEKQEYDSFKSSCNRASIENSTLVKDRMLGTVYMLLNPNQLPTKVSSKLRVALFTNN